MKRFMRILLAACIAALGCGLLTACAKQGAGSEAVTEQSTAEPSEKATITVNGTEYTLPFRLSDISTDYTLKGLYGFYGAKSSDGVKADRR